VTGWYVGVDVCQHNSQRSSRYLCLTSYTAISVFSRDWIGSDWIRAWIPMIVEIL